MFEQQSNNNVLSLRSGKIDMASTPTSTKEEGQDAQEERSNVQFPWKLHEMLVAAENNGNASIVSWLPGGKAFKVHNKLEFTTKILPTLFNATKYKSFQRNLNLWGFETISEGPHKGGSFHPLFVKGDPDQCHYMTRQKVKVNNKRPSGASPSLHASTSVPMVGNAISGQPQHQAVATHASLAHRQDAAFALPSFLTNTTNRDVVAMGSVSDGPSNRTAAALANIGAMSLPRKLHHMCTRSEFNTDCLSWTPDKRCIKIINPLKFQQLVLPTYFGHSSYAAFANELGNFGFTKIVRDGNPECYYHDLMIQGMSHLCKYMSTAEESRRFRTEHPELDSIDGKANSGIPGADTTKNRSMDAASVDLLRMLQQQQQHQQAVAAANAAQIPSLSSLVSGLLSQQSSSNINASRMASAPAPMDNSSASSMQQLAQLQSRLGAATGGGSFQHQSSLQQQQFAALIAAASGVGSGTGTGGTTTGAPAPAGMDLQAALASLAPSLLIQQQQGQFGGFSPTSSSSQQPQLGGAATGSSALAILSALQMNQQQQQQQQYAGADQQQQLMRRLMDMAGASSQAPSSSGTSSSNKNTPI